MWLSLIIGSVLSAFKLAVKNPKKAAEIRDYALQIATQIEVIWGNDPAFQQELGIAVAREKRTQ